MVKRGQGGGRGFGREVVSIGRKRQQDILALCDIRKRGKDKGMDFWAKQDLGIGKKTFA